VTQTLGQEVFSYFESLLTVYRVELFAFIFVVIVIVAAYFLINSRPRV
jgi:hypothetical protein